MDLASIALVLVAALAGVGWLKRRLHGPGRAPRQSVVLTNQHSLHVVELDGERLLVGTGPSGSPRLLAKLPARELDDRRDAAPVPGDWLAELTRMIGGVRGR